MPGSASSAKNQVQAGLADKILILEVQKWSESFRTDPVFQDMAACAVNRWNSSPHAELGWIQGCTGQYSVCPGVPLKQSCQAQDRVWYFSFNEFITVALETAGVGSGEGAVAVWRSQGFIVHFGEEKAQSSQSECAARMWLGQIISVQTSWCGSSHSRCQWGSTGNRNVFSRQLCQGVDSPSKLCSAFGLSS